MMNKLIKFMKVYIDKNRIEVKFLLLLLTVILLWLCMYKSDLTYKVLRHVTHTSNRNEEQFIYDFVSGMEVRQVFSCYEDFDFITLSFSDHDKRQKGKLGIQIIDTQTKKSIIYEEIDMRSIYYTEPLRVSFSEIGGGRADRKYEIILRSADTKKSAVGIFGYLNEEEPALVNGEKSEYALSIGMHSNTNIYSNLTKLVFIIAIISCLLIIEGTFKIHMKEHNLFLLLSIPFILCMLFMWPGNSVYDEGRHYSTVYNYSNAVLGHGKSDNIRELSVRKADTTDSELEEGLVGAINAQAHKMGYYTERMFEKPESYEMTVENIARGAIVQNGTIVEYAPLTIGMIVGRLLGFNYYWMNVMARVVNIVCYLALCYFAICKIPVLKSMLVLLCSLPMNLYQAAGISYDGITFAIGIFVFSCIIRLWVMGLTKREWVLFSLAAFLLGSCKGGVYLTLLLLMCLIPREKYESKKCIKIGGVIGIGGISMLISFVPTFMRWFGLGGNAPTIVNEVETTTGNLHLTYMLYEPIEFLKKLMLTLMENGDMYLGQLLGYRTAWANDVISNVVMLPFLILLTLSVLKVKEDDFQLDVKSRIGILGIIVIELIGMHAIFLVDTSVYSNIIIGCQGRYFILFLPCILLLFRNNGLIFKEKKEYLYPLYSMAQFVYLYFFLELFMCA